MRFQISQPQKPYPLRGFGGEALGHTYAATNRYLTRDGEPYLYRMGEFHFSRVPRRDWETELQKMKDGGIEIVASYLFWIHHEEHEGVFDFSDNRDLRAFCEVCKKLELPFFLRLGPWAHGEARNGGFPDWLLQKCGGKEGTRTNAEPYLSCVRRYFTRVYEEIRELMDVVVGIQVENELHRNAEHMETLYLLIREIGFRAPLWTATGWGPGGRGAELPKGILLPVYGGYPDAPWAAHIEPILGNDTFRFSTNWNSAGIGTDIFEAEGFINETELPDSHKNPYLTCEIGTGNQVTYHRRPIISSRDVAAGVICRLGSGCNGLGYYMYHGGRNPIGSTTMQESRKTGYKNDYAMVSYDFQAPIGECGQLRQSYYELASIHSFLDLVGKKLATMPAYLPLQASEEQSETKMLRCAVRSDGESGFFFFNNHTHAEKMGAIDESIGIELTEGNKPVEFQISLPAGTYGVIPFRFSIGRERVEWITAMPLRSDDHSFTFETLTDILPQVCLSDGRILPLTDGMEIGDVLIRLQAKPRKKEENLLPLTVIERGQLLSNDVFAHLENRDGSMLETAKSMDYEIFLPQGVDYLAIDAIGNVGALFCDGALLSDYFFNGNRWFADVRSVSPASQLILKILPLTEQNRQQIYFEATMPIGVCAPSVYALLPQKE